MKLLINNEVITHISNLSWSDDLENFANSFTFTTDIQIEPASQVAIIDEKTNTTVLVGIITDYSQDEADLFNYSGFDFGFYLTHNAIVKQFNGVKVSNAIITLCNNFNLPIGRVEALNSTITKIYKNKKISDVIKELLELNQAKTFKDCFYVSTYDGKISIKKYEVLKNASFLVADDLAIAPNSSIQNFNVTVSMENLRNKVIIADNKGDNVIKKVVVQDGASISKYGLLQHVETVDKDTTNNFTTIAKNKLKELNKLTTTLSMNLLGDSRLRKGVILPIKNDEYDIEGNFLITSSSHSITAKKEIVKVNLLKYDIGKL